MRWFLWCVGEGLCPSRRRPQGSPLRRGYKRCGAKRNPPVTALPCQPPLGKGAEGTGEADCHSQCAHWLRNDREFYMGCGGISGGRTGASAPTEMSEHLRRAAYPHAAVMVRWLTGGGLRAARPTEAYFAVRRGGALPLPRATARIAPTEALQEVRCGERTPQSRLRRTSPFRQGGRGDGRTDCHSQCAHWLRNDTLQGVRWRRADVGIGPYGVFTDRTS